MTPTTEPTTTPADAATGQPGALDDKAMSRICKALSRDDVFEIIRLIVRQKAMTWKDVFAAIEADRPGDGCHAVNTCLALVDVGLFERVELAGTAAYSLNRPGLASFAAAISALGAGTIGGGA